jgi:hypothetical protein
LFTFTPQKLAGTLVPENVWAGYSVLFGEDQPLVWLAPRVTFVLIATAFFSLPDAMPQFRLKGVMPTRSSWFDDEAVTQITLVG